MTSPQAPFGRMLTAMVTAFTDDGSVDLEGVARTAAYLVEHGNDGVVVNGTTGESPTVTGDEFAQVVKAVQGAVGPGRSVVAGVGSNDTRHSIELARTAADLGADAILLVTPYYNKPGQAGILHHFRAVAAATDLPVMLYDVPGRTGSTIGLDTYARLADDERITSVKDATADFSRAARIAGLGYAVYSGDDSATLGFLAHGGCGLVSVVGHVAGTRLAGMIDDFLAGRLDAALASYQALLPVMDAVMSVPNYGATTAKAGLQLQGVLGNRAVRSPLVPLDEQEYDALAAALRAADLI